MSSEFENKLIILLALESIGFMSKNELNSILSDGGMLGYIDMVLALDVLVEDASVAQREMYYEITQKGKEELDLFLNKIPNSIKNNLLLNAPDHKSSLNQHRDVVVFYSRQADRYHVDIYMYVDGLLFLKVKHASREKNNVNIAQHAKQNRDKLYNVIWDLGKAVDTTRDSVSRGEVQLFMEQGLQYMKVSYEVGNDFWELRFLVPFRDEIDIFVNNWHYRADEIVADIKKLLLDA